MGTACQTISAQSPVSPQNQCLSFLPFLNYPSYCEAPIVPRTPAPSARPAKISSNLAFFPSSIFSCFFFRFFWQKMPKWRPKGAKLVPKWSPKVVLGPSFSEFGEPLFLNNPPMVLAYFRDAKTPRNGEKAVQKTDEAPRHHKKGKNRIFYGKMSKMGQNGGQNVAVFLPCYGCFSCSSFFLVFSSSWGGFGAYFGSLRPIFGFQNPILEPIWLQLCVQTPIGEATWPSLGAKNSFIASLSWALAA